MVDGERIEVDHQQVDGRDAFARHHRIVGAAASQQAAVDLRVQRLDAPVHDFRKAGDAGHFTNRDAGCRQRARGATGGKQFDTARGQGARQVDQAGLVGNRQQRATDRLIHGFACLYEVTPTGRIRATSCAACRD